MNEVGLHIELNPDGSIAKGNQFQGAIETSKEKPVYDYIFRTINKELKAFRQIQVIALS